MKLLVLIAILGSFSTGAFAGEKIDITVKGMVCSFCSQGITKKFKEEGVKSVNVDLENQKLPQEKIQKILTDSGYGVEKIETK